MGNKQSDHKIAPIILNLDANPSSDAEREKKSLLDPLVKKSPQLLEVIDHYDGCESYIRNALNNPNTEAEMNAFAAVEIAVNKLHKFYKFAQTMEKGFQPLLVALFTGDARSNVQSNQTLVCQFGQMFKFAFRFDEMKMTKPAIQNDFSYYRRVLSRMRNKDETGTKKKRKVDEDLANTMTFFFAYPSPMTKILIDATLKTANERLNSESLINGLSLLANVCYSNIVDTTSVDEDKIFQIMCMMTGAIILVDHLLPQGAFTKKSPIRIKSCISALKSMNGSINSGTLINCLRFSTTHLNDEQSMAEVKKMLG